MGNEKSEIGDVPCSTISTPDQVVAALTRSYAEEEEVTSTMSAERWDPFTPQSLPHSGSTNSALLATDKVLLSLIGGDLPALTDLPVARIFRILNVVPNLC